MDAMDKAVRAACVVHAVGLRCTYPNCACKITPPIARAAVLAFLDAAQEPTKAMVNAAEIDMQKQGVGMDAFCNPWFPDATYRAMLAELRKSVEPPVQKDPAHR